MTMLLASVTSGREAELALAHGADIIDLKEPANGALGALDPAVVREAVTAVAGRRPTSAVTGDLPMDPGTIVAAVQSMAATGVDFVKVGLFPNPQRDECIRALAPLAQRIRIVGVMFADCETESTSAVSRTRPGIGGATGLVPLLAQAGFAGAMLDTARKGAGRLLDHADVAILAQFVRTCRSHGLMTGLAGSLEAPDVPRLLLLSPDYLGFRGALCVRHDRRAGLDPAAFGLIRALIPLDPRSPVVERTEPEKPDYWLVAARGYSGSPPKDGAAADRILVHDFILPVRIGVYGNEHGAPQDVRFNVDAEIARAAQPAQDMRDVLSYDIIADGIRLIAADGHIPLVETLAERIANFVLGHAQVQRVTVKVEKLQVGSGRVGVEITRQRSAEVAKVYHLYPAARGKGGGAASAD
jgi:dihydroneopterin aldolase